MKKELSEKKIRSAKIETMFVRARAQARAAGMKRSDIPKIIKQVRKKTKRNMKDEHFQELLASVQQMGDYLKGKKVPGVKITYRAKPTRAKNSKPRETTKIINGTTNVYVDIGLKDAKGMLAKAELAFKIDEFIRSQKLSRAKAARIIDIPLNQLIDLLRGRFRDISIAQLKTYLKQMEIDADPLAEDMSGYIGKLNWRKAHFKFTSKGAPVKQDLRNPEVALKYLQRRMDESIGSFLTALRDVAEAQGISEVARKAKMTVSQIMRATQPKADPAFASVYKFLNTVGFRFTVQRIRNSNQRKIQ
jgi:DNA-binding phage protein/predicted XRE-type DNA-binding protein